MVTSRVLSAPPLIRREDQITVALDLDNTLVDFTDGFRRALATKFGLSRRESLERFPEPTNYSFHKGEVPWFSDLNEFLDNFKEAEEQGLYRNLVAYTGGVQVIKKALKDKRINLEVVTARGEQHKEDSLSNLRSLGLPFTANDIYHVSDKADRLAHIFIDDKDGFAEEIQSGSFVMPDGITKRIIVPERGYNRHVATASNWHEINSQLNKAVDEMWTIKQAS